VLQVRQSEEGETGSMYCTVALHTCAVLWQLQWRSGFAWNTAHISGARMPVRRDCCCGSESRCCKRGNVAQWLLPQGRRRGTAAGETNSAYCTMYCSARDWHVCSAKAARVMRCVFACTAGLLLWVCSCGTPGGVEHFRL
jgi:hypothetical protein